MDHTARTTFFHQQINLELEGIPNVNVLELALAKWPVALDLSPLERVTGLAVRVGPAVSDDPDDGHRVVVWACPEVMATTSEALPMSPNPRSEMLYVDVDAPIPEADPDDPSADVGPILFADNFGRVLAQTVLTEIEHAGLDEYDRQTATSKALFQLHPAAAQMLSIVQLAAMDRLAGSQA